VTQSSPVIAVKSAGLLLYFIRTKENQVGANKKIMTQQENPQQGNKLKKPKIWYNAVVNWGG
jgi:phosphate/sulfate permease